MTTKSAAYPSQPTSYPNPAFTSSSDYPAPVLPNSLDKPNDIKPFKINKPINIGSTQISGTGPKNIPISIIDITMNGKLIGTATIGNNEEFSLSVSPLESSHRLGIRINSSDGITYNGYDYSDEGFQGEEPKSVPNVGYFFDTVLIE